MTSCHWHLAKYDHLLKSNFPQSAVQPFGGYALACDFFLKHLTIPATMMDTYTNFDFGVTLQVDNNTVKNSTSVYVDRMGYKPDLPAFPEHMGYIVKSNPIAYL